MRTSVWVIVFCPSTGSYLLGFRGPKMNNPSLWNLWGGSVDQGENLKQAALRELYEESGLTGRIDSLGSLNSKGSEAYYFLLEADYEVAPKLDHETAKAKWFSLERVKQLLERKKLHGPTAKLFASNLLKAT